MEDLTVIILAAGKGTRMKSKTKNKVTLEVKGEPMLARTLKILKSAGIRSVVVVVGFAKESVLPLLSKDILVAEQTRRLGTGHAVKIALDKVPKTTKDVLILYGDDTFMYSPETFQELYSTHKKENAQVTFITMDTENPTGYGRIIRDKENEVIGIVEEKNASAHQKKIKEINLGCYILSRDYLQKNIGHIEKNQLTGEYYITDMIDIISHNKDKIAAHKLTKDKWRGVNTKEDLMVAEQLVA